MKNLLKVSWAVEAVQHDGFSIESAALRYGVYNAEVIARIRQDEIEADDGTQERTIAV